jgi:hypothetical protein
MITILPKTQTQKETVQITMQGGAGDVAAMCRSLADALAEVDDKDSRKTLAALLKAILPAEHQITEPNQP